MTTEITLAPKEKRYVLANMWTAYAHELSQYQTDLPSVHGLMGDEDGDYDPESIMAEWWEHPEGAFPYLLSVDERPAGFALVAAPPLVDGDMDKMLLEFFLFHPYRGKGLGRAAAHKVFAQFAGSWELSVITSNTPALEFWKATLEDAVVSQKVIDELPMTVFSFLRG